jgi:cytochrome c oxidase cbb3-type subunit 3
MSKKDELLDSNYDGIQEYDNDLPKWWSNLFIITIVFALIYVPYYMLGFGPSSKQDLDQQLAGIKAVSAKPAASSAEIDLVAISRDAARIGKGREVFAAKCSPCHASDGGGLVGPNLTDQVWIHGGKLSEIRHTIEVGVPEKGMLAWKGLISNDEIFDVVAFIRSIRGTHPANPKEPQGEPYNGDE